MLFKQGDIVFMDFNPTRGHEQAGRRPALIVSNNDYNRIMGLYIVCPITNNTKVFPSHILLPSGLSTTGAVLCEHVRTVDIEKRNPIKKEECPASTLDEVLEIVESLF